MRSCGTVPLILILCAVLAAGAVLGGLLPDRGHPGPIADTPAPPHPAQQGG